LINLVYFTLLALYLMNAITNRDQLRSLLGWLMVTIGVSSVAAVAESVLGRTTSWSSFGMLDEANTLVSAPEVRRSGGLLGGANLFAMVLAQMLPLMLAQFLSPVAAYRKTLLAGGLGVGVLALILTYSRGGWLAFGLMLLILLPLMASRRFGAASISVVKKVAVLVVLLVALAAPLYGNVYTRLTEDDQGSARSRVPMMGVAWRIIQDNPLFGVGLGNYENVMDRYDQGPERAHQSFPWPVHNIYLNITAEVGLVGGVCFLFIAGLALWQGVRAMRTPDSFVRAAAIGLVTGLVGYLLVGVKELGPLGAAQHRFFWLAAGLLVATRRVSENGVFQQMKSAN
jgi:O-antigen ligase